ncbi:hypothetical protein HW555_013513 [Spodoptera exigua]|uniref:Uncharacterized protein n=1 Tax=Spodoptera exigua TaxID=7107 RepID=A0A835G4M1_SPOEX|nr:hypothetical protein HW555_013513 [Spodoptera exigua]
MDQNSFCNTVSRVRYLQLINPVISRTTIAILDLMFVEFVKQATYSRVECSLTEDRVSLLLAEGMWDRARRRTTSCSRSQRPPPPRSRSSIVERRIGLAARRDGASSAPAAGAAGVGARGGGAAPAVAGPLAAAAAGAGARRALGAALRGQAPGSRRQAQGRLRVLGSVLTPTPSLRPQADTVSLRATQPGPKLFSYHDVDDAELAAAGRGCSAREMEDAVALHDALQALHAGHKVPGPLHPCSTTLRLPPCSTTLPLQTSSSRRSRRSRPRHWLDAQASETDL